MAFPLCPLPAWILRPVALQIFTDFSPFRHPPPPALEQPRRPVRAWLSNQGGSAGCFPSVGFKNPQSS